METPGKHGHSDRKYSAKFGFDDAVLVSRGCTSLAYPHPNFTTSIVAYSAALNRRFKTTARAICPH